jgi:uncharacterized membrane protein YkvA (DUF1232 family)
MNLKNTLDAAKQWARRLKRDVVALWLAARDRRTPLSAKIVAGCVAAYALSPVDLIPDFIPVLGYLDDLIIVPLGIVWAVRLVPPVLMAELRGLASARPARPVSRAGLAAVLAIWIVVAGLVVVFLALIFCPDGGALARIWPCVSG